ncbi:MAG: hypothetical protein E6I73_13350 [Chloroflexi bacterium]|nr:MAG: hypothetical protein E6I73_13350 [Chloroflexota bacterium]
MSTAKHSEYSAGVALYAAAPIFSSSYCTAAATAVLRLARAVSSTPVLNAPTISTSTRPMIKVETRSSISVVPACCRCLRRRRSGSISGRPSGGHTSGG